MRRPTHSLALRIRGASTPTPQLSRFVMPSDRCEGPFGGSGLGSGPACSEDCTADEQLSVSFHHGTKLTLLIVWLEGLVPAGFSAGCDARARFLPEFPVASRVPRAMSLLDTPRRGDI